MDAGTGGPDRVFGVHGVRQGNVDGIDDAEALVELLVGEGMVNPISAADLTALGPVPADDRHQPGVAARVSERRNHRHLSDVSKAHDAVSDSSLCRRHRSVDGLINLIVTQAFDGREQVRRPSL